MNLANSDTPPFAPTNAAIAMDEDGYLLNPELWNPALASVIAQNEGITALSEAHWRILNYVRDYHHQFGVMPAVRRVCNRQGLAKTDLKRLFPSCLIAWRIAGLPNPGEEAKAYLG